MIVSIKVKRRDISSNSANDKEGIYKEMAGKK